MLDTFVFGSGCLLVLARLLEVPALIAVPMALAGALAVTIDVDRELKRLNAEASTRRREDGSALRR
jgi:hypothetical protein